MKYWSDKMQATVYSVFSKIPFMERKQDKNKEKKSCVIYRCAKGKYLCPGHKLYFSSHWDSNIQMKCYVSWGRNYYSPSNTWKQ